MYRNGVYNPSEDNPAPDVCLRCNGTGMGIFGHNRKAPCDECEGTGINPESSRLLSPKEKASVRFHARFGIGCPLNATEKSITELVDKVAEAQLAKATELFEADLKALEEAHQDKIDEMFREIICPMCYRLNPNHATADNGVGCKSCEEKEGYCGKIGLS